MARNKLKNKIKLSSNMIAFLGSSIIVLGLILLTYNFVGKRRMLAYQYINEQINMYVDVKEVSSEEEKPQDEPSIEQEPTDLEHYIGYLEIPKINFNRGFYHVDSSFNTVEQNIQVIRGSSMPTVKGGNLIIAGHSGTGWKAFFNELYHLTLGDSAIVTYNGHKYTYKITNIYTQPKTGQITIRRNKTKNTLTLITCTNNSNTTQTIYILELDKKE